jgi:hypothetical protein
MSDKQDERDGQATKRRKLAYDVYATMDGEVRISRDEVSYLGTISPFFDSASLASRGSRFIRAPSAFVARCIAVVTSFVEWQQLDEGELKRKFQARVAAMVRSLTACPFDETYALRLGMADPLRDMEATLDSGDASAGNGPVGAFGPVGGVGGLVGREWYSRLTAKDASALVGVSFANTSSPVETRGRAAVCAFFVVKGRGDAASKEKFRNIALCLRHFEIRHEANVYDAHTETLVVRGRDSPHGCAIRGIDVIHGLASSAVIDLAQIDRHDDRKRISYKDTATILGIMRIQKARLQTTTERPDALALLVEYLDAVALELANM